MRVLVLNAGSSTLKASRLEGDADSGDDVTLEWPAGEADADRVLAAVLERLPGDTDAVGHRVVHGGAGHDRPAVVDDHLVGEVEALDVLAPLHNRRAASVMRAGLAALPGVPHVACFDTAFHAALPEEARHYALPADWVGRWAIRRYGFHGLSVAWSTRRAAELLERPVSDLRIVVAHLGSGCSVTAVERGRSVDTSMGFTPYEGLMMGTRSGSVDPGILLRLAADGMSPDDLADGLAKRSGLLAIGGTPDVRELTERAGRDDGDARLALGMFSRRAAAAIAGSATALGHLDAVVFTGGIGEHAAAVRADIVRRLAVIGLPRQLVSADGEGILADGPPAVIVVMAREDRVIADEVGAFLA